MSVIKHLFWLLVLGLVLVYQAHASDPVWLNNLGENATGTTTGAKHGLDVYVTDGSLSFTELATAADGGTLPAEQKIIGGYDGTNTQAIKTDSDGNLQVDVLSSALPTGAATEAKQPALGTAGTASSDVITVQGISGMTAVKVDGSAVTQPVSGTVTANQGGTWNVTDISGTVSLPTGAATAAKQDTGNTSLSSIDGKLPSTLGTKTAANSLSVTFASDQTQNIGRSYVTSVRNAYASTSVTSGAWVQLVASLSDDVNEIEIFDSSGQTLELGVGAAASEARTAIIVPGGNGRIPLRIASGTRVSVRAISATASVGELDINFYK